MGEVIVALDDIEPCASFTVNDVFPGVQNGRNDRSKLAEAGEKLAFEFDRLRGEILDAVIDEMALPEVGGATAADAVGLFEEMDLDCRRGGAPGRS